MKRSCRILLFGALACVGWIFGGISSAQSPGQQVSSKEHQRWIPVYRPSEEDLEELLNALKKSKQVSQAPATSPSIPGFVKEGLKRVTPEQIDRTLGQLSQSQKNELKKLAQQFQTSDNEAWQKKAVEGLPPEVLEQLKQSKELQKIAKELSGKTPDELDSPDKTESSTPSENAFGADADEQQPWIRFNPGMASNGDRAKSNANPNSNDESKAENSRQDLSPAKTQDKRSSSLQRSPREFPQRGIGNADSKETELQQPRENGTGLDSTSLDRPQSKVPQPESQVNGVDSSQGNVSRPTQRRSSSFQPNARSSSSNSRPESRSSQSPSGGVVQKENNNSDTRIPNVSGDEKPSESAVDMFRKKLDEFGLGRTMTKLAQEAMGVEQSRSSGASSSASSSQAGSAKKDRSDAQDQMMQQIPNIDQRRDSIVEQRPEPKKDSARSNKQDSAISATPSPSTRNATSGSRNNVPSVPQPSARSEATSSPFQMPEISELPSFSLWHLVLVVAIVGLVVSLFLLQRSPELMAKITGRPSHALPALDFGPMEIKNREHVIHAFHRVIQHRIKSLEDWWTSKLVVSYAKQHASDSHSSLSNAASVYEIARYAPANVELSEGELETMRQAVRDCTSAKGD